MIAKWAAAGRPGNLGQTSADGDTPLHVRLDGKTVRGTVNTNGEQLDLLSALVGSSHPRAVTLVIAQAPAGSAKTSEPAIARACSKPSTCAAR